MEMASSLQADRTLAGSSSFGVQNTHSVFSSLERMSDLLHRRAISNFQAGHLSSTFALDQGEIEKRDLDGPSREGSPKAKKKASKKATDVEVTAQAEKRQKKRKPESPIKASKEVQHFCLCLSSSMMMSAEIRASHERLWRSCRRKEL